MYRHSFRGIYSACFFGTASWICGLVLDTNSGNFSSIIFFKYFFCSFLFSFWYSHYIHTILFVVVPVLIVFVCLFFFPSSLCSFCFLVLEVSFEISSHSEIPSSAVFDLLISSSRAFLISVPVL